MFDFIIVGAGSAGCVLANRLSADPSRKVLLLEAGPPDRNPLIHIPLGLAVLARTRGINWGLHTERQAHMDGRHMYWPRGKTLGGSSSINAMIYMRGHPADYAAWEHAAGPLWGWERMRAHFLRLEGQTGQVPREGHGFDGPLTVSDLRHVNPLSRAFVQAGVQAGWPANPDFNADLGQASQEGVGLYQVTQREGQRFSSARAFLEPVRQRPNLVVQTGCQVRRILWDGKRATGVELEGGGPLGAACRLNPGGEVLLCGGAVNSPHLLMASGIGPADDLQRLGVPVVHHAPEVGANLTDHLDVPVLAATHGSTAIGVAPGLLPRLWRAGWAYARHRQGELTSNVGEAGGFARSDAGRDRPNLQFHFLPALLKDHGRTTAWGYGVTLHVCDLLPRSRGRIALRSADPLVPPAIDPAYLSHPADAPVLLAGLKLARRMLAAPALAAYIRAELQPGASVQSDEDLLADIRARAETIYHPASTCRMGTDDASVVDPHARVRGVQGLRVADASIMPTLVAGNTNAPTMALADNVADLMLG